MNTETIAADLFDVFIAYNSRDGQVAQAICNELKKRRIVPWFAPEQIRPGESFQDAVQAAISSARSAAIIIGTSGIGNWQMLELRGFIAECVEDGKPVIPILLANAKFPHGLKFLTQFNCVHLTDMDIALQNDALNLLCWGITGERPHSEFAYDSAALGCDHDS